MKYFILIPVGFISFILLFWSVACPWIYCEKNSVYSFNDLNFPKKDPDFILPKGYSLLYNSATKEYIIHVQDKRFGNLDTELRLYIYSDFGLNSDMNSSCDEKDATRFKDSSVAKFYAHLWYSEQNGFKPLTK